jgi:hypothetical protein
MPVDTALLERANWWFDLSWYGLLGAGLLTSAGAIATVLFLFLQFWSGGVRERHSDWRTSSLELETRKANAELAKANADIANANKAIALANKEAAVARAETERLKRQAEDLALKATNAERGVTDIYDYNGARRQTTAGRTSVIVGDETGTFQKIIELQKAGDWHALHDVAEAQIGKTPRWLTPYLFSGVAYANLGDLAKAEERLSFVVANAGSDPNYAEAANLLARIRAQRR